MNLFKTISLAWIILWIGIPAYALCPEWECAPDEQMPDVFGINATAFPPPEKLTEEQALRINQAILKLWEVNHILADLPEKLTSQLILYRELRKKWQEDAIRIMP